MCCDVFHSLLQLENSYLTMCVSSYMETLTDCVWNTDIYPFFFYKLLHYFTFINTVFFLLKIYDNLLSDDWLDCELGWVGPATVVCDYMGYIFMFLSIATSNMVATSLARRVSFLNICGCYYFCQYC